MYVTTDAVVRLESEDHEPDNILTRFSAAGSVCEATAAIATEDRSLSAVTDRSHLAEDRRPTMVTAEPRTEFPPGTPRDVRRRELAAAYDQMVVAVTNRHLQLQNQIAWQMVDALVSA